MECWGRLVIAKLRLVVSPGSARPWIIDARGARGERGARGARLEELNEPSIDVGRLIQLFERARDLFPGRVTCLESSLALAQMLRRRGIAAQVAIGVRREGESFEAHAWVSSPDLSPDESPDVPSPEIRGFKTLRSAPARWR